MEFICGECGTLLNDKNVIIKEGHLTNGWGKTILIRCKDCVEWKKE